jgi:hypothetical protein
MVPDVKKVVQCAYEVHSKEECAQVAKILVGVNASAADVPLDAILYQAQRHRYARRQLFGDLTRSAVVGQLQNMLL